MFKKAIFTGLVLLILFCYFRTYADDSLFKEMSNPSWLSDIEKPAWMPDVEGGITFETKYIWRGQKIVDDFVLQPEASISKYGLALSWWGNFSTANSHQGRWTEHDYTIDYSSNIGEVRKYLNADDGTMGFINSVGFSAGHIFYIFPESSGKNFHSEEFYFGVSYDCLLQPFATWYIDYARGSGSYIEFGVAPSVDLGNGVEFAAGVTAGYNAGQWGYGYKFAPVLFSAEISVPILKYFTVTPNINYSLAVDRSEKDNGLAYGSEFYGGIKISAAY